MKKIAIDDELESKKSISSRVLPKQETATFLKDIFSTFQETEHTKKIYQKLQEAADQSETYVDFWNSYSSNVPRRRLSIG